MTTTKESVRRAIRTVIAGREPGADEIGTRRGIVVERISPQIDGGRYPVKRVVGDQLLVTADILADGHGLLDAALLVRADDETEWRETPMRPIDNDRWSGHVELPRNRRHSYAIEAWRDAFGSWLHGLQRKLEAGVAVPVELEEGRILVESALERAEEAEAADDVLSLRSALASFGRSRSEATRVAALGGDDLAAAMRRHPDRRFASRSAELPLVVDRERARFGAWYELFPRSQGRDPKKPAATTFAEAEWRLPEIAAMGFDVVYLPPIHPIGHTNRKGRNNVARGGAGRRRIAVRHRVGRRWATTPWRPSSAGSRGCARFREAVEAHGMELAMDIAIQASPDHPYVSTHPEWFRHAPDGTIKYAENPPKKYQDIYPIDFDDEDHGAREALWHEWKRIFEVWIERGSPHLPRRQPAHQADRVLGLAHPEPSSADHPDVIFLSEAFTKPKMMRQLAKVGFTQSYTYFTWRESAAELRDYLTELTQTEMREYFRGNLFTNTPDINPHHLDHGRPAFVIRTVLAATLSSSYGIYSGWELCESARLGEREEYLDSEKYEIRARDWDAKGNIKLLIGELNRLRHERPALKRYDNLRFEAVSGERTLFYRKAMPHGKVDPLTGHPHRWRDPVYVAVNCDPTTPERAILHPDLPAVGIGWDEPYQLTDLLTGATSRERGADLAVVLDPAAEAFRIFTISKLSADS